MNDAPKLHDGRCTASGQTITPYVIEPLMTMLCPECGADVPLHPTDASPADWEIIPHEPRQAIGRRSIRGTQLMLGL
jgi:hypothetical protein